MKELLINGQTGRSKLLIGEHLAALPAYVPPHKTVIITDPTVGSLYGDLFPPVPTLRIGTGEGVKTLRTVEQLFTQLVALEADRSAFIVGIGGGIVCDITGFVAATFMRGVAFGFVATTLLAQVDASVGGKNGVNFEGYKNMVGVFRQPRFVICDAHLLNSLPPSEIACGLAEIVKHAAIGDSAMFSYLEHHAEKALSLDPKVLEKLVCASVRLKAQVVSADETEQGERRKLNFGHTLGHALEKVTGCSHGQAVSLGMVFAARLALKRGLMEQSELDRLLALLARLRLPTSLPTANRDCIIDALRKDKKREGNHIHFVLLKGIGQARIEPVPLKLLENMISNWP